MIFRSFLYSFCSLLISERIAAIEESRYPNATHENSILKQVKASSALDVGLSILFALNIVLKAHVREIKYFVTQSP